MEFNYSKLRGKIKEIYGTQEALAQKIGISKASLSGKLNNQVDFTQSEIVKMLVLLEIPNANTSDYFLRLKSNKFDQMLKSFSATN